jgi:hypothetical protein
VNPANFDSFLALASCQRAVYELDERQEEKVQIPRRALATVLRDSAEKDTKLVDLERGKASRITMSSAGHPRSSSEFQNAPKTRRLRRAETKRNPGSNYQLSNFATEWNLITV